ncbi:MAG: TetR/AcrR family transcriptional regulator [Coriobacteriia bacterium]
MHEEQMKHVIFCSDFETKMAILNGMDRLMEQTPLDLLLVTNICRESSVSRQTFYHHFNSKYDVANWYWELIIGETDLRETGRTYTWYESTLRALEEGIERRSFFHHVLQSEDPNSLTKFSRRRRRQYLIEAIIDRTGMKPSEEVLFQIDFFTDAETRAVAEWGRNNMSLPPARLSRLIEASVPPTLHRLLA